MIKRLPPFRDVDEGLPSRALHNADVRLHALGLATVIGALVSTLYFLNLADDAARLASAMSLFTLASCLLLYRSARRQALRSKSLAQQLEATQRSAETDPLTGIMNRMAFHKVLDRCEEQGGVVTLIYFDLNKFKDINDTLGHKYGDLLLVEVARRATSVLEGAYVVARLGGDEFAAIMPFNSGQTPDQFGLRLIEVMKPKFVLPEKSLSVGLSIGIAVGNPSIDSAEDMLRRADVAMYEAKTSGETSFHVFDDALDSRQSFESSIRVELGDSVIGKELALNYQPIFDARSGEVARCEALLRWQSHKIGSVSPGLLIPIAEDTGHIAAITEWTLDASFNAIHQLGNVPVSVNISPIYFRNADFVDRLFNRMLNAGIPPEMLTIELVEGVLISNMESARKTIGAMRDVGINVYLDDFGTGYSSLSYLQHFELDGLKLDKSFLRDLGERQRASQIIRTVVEFGHNLDMKVVVEGIETEWQARLLQLIGSDYLQGFHLGVPTDLASFQKFLKESREAIAASAAAAEPKPHDQPARWALGE